MKPTKLSKDLHSFIKSECYIPLEIISYKKSGNNYKVKCNLIISDIVLLKTHTEEKFCIVNIKQFNLWKESRKKIIWID